MNISISKFVGVAACAALFAQPVYAGCSGNTDLILNSSAAVAAITPIPGSKYASAALKLGALFSCKENGEVQALQIADVGLYYRLGLHLCGDPVNRSGPAHGDRSGLCAAVLRTPQSSHYVYCDRLSIDGDRHLRALLSDFMVG